MLPYWLYNLRLLLDEQDCAVQTEVDGIKHNGLRNNLRTLSIAELHRQTNGSNSDQVNKPRHAAPSPRPLNVLHALSVFITLVSCLF